MATMQEIEQFAAKFSARREALAGSMMAFREEQSALERKHFGRLHRLAVQMKEAQAELHAAIVQSPEHFDKPRTVILHGIKVGFGKGRGKIEWEDDDQVVKLIHRHFPEQAELLIQTVEKPLKGPLAQLSVAELKRLSITVEETGDAVVIKPIDSEIDKALKALIKELPKEVEEVE